LTHDHKGEIAGSVVGRAVGVALIITALWYFISNYRKQQRQQPQSPSAIHYTSIKESPGKVLQLPVLQIDSQSRPSEIASSEIQAALYELPEGR
jgi:hypothetical protein